MTGHKYIPALSLQWLTPFYDAIIEGPMSAMHIRGDLVKQMMDMDGKRVLDVGCGTGTLAILVKQTYPGAEVCGLDGDPRILAIARTKAEQAHADVQFHEGLSFMLPFPDGSFDFVLTSFMLHHLDRAAKLQTASEMYRVLRHGGTLLGVDFTTSRGALGKAVQPLARRLERISDNLEGFLPVMFARAGFQDYQEVSRYVFGSLSLFRGSKA